MDYIEFIRDKLEPDPLGKTVDELTDSLPPEGAEETLQKKLESLEEKGRVQKVGNNWRWADF